MSDSPGQEKGTIAQIAAVCTTALKSVPPQFLVLVALNAVFILGLLWFLLEQGRGRERIVQQIVSACLQKKMGDD